MAWTNWGFDGTINEAQWSQMAGLLGNDYVAAGNGDCVVTAVAGARSVSVAAGTLYGDGVVSVNSAPEVVAMTTPVNGQWYVIALQRAWATNVSALVSIAGATTSTSTPTAPPTSFPTLNTQPGVLTDQPIAWAWCNSANTTVVVYDIRKRAVKSMPPVVANAAERDAKFMTPTQGLTVWRDDLGRQETYYALYNGSTNVGGRNPAGWYATPKNRVIQQDQITQNSAQAVTAGAGTVDYIGVSVSITPTSANSIIQVEFYFPRALCSNVGWIGSQLALNGTVVKTNDVYNGVATGATTGPAIFYAMIAGDLTTKSFNIKINIQAGTLTASLGTLIVREIGA